MSWTVPVALYGWIPLVAIAFTLFPPWRAALLSYLAGWMFLPMARIEILGFFDFGKGTAVPLVVLLAMLVFDGRALSRFQPRWFDAPVAAYCAVPIATSLSNGLGVYDALSSCAYQTISWGLPYLTGRVYFGSPEGARRLATHLAGAGLIYAPLCLWEIRMSPQLHATVYGFHQHEWVQTLRGGGYRPMVFMEHGLMVGLWMCAAAIAATAMWMSGALRKLWGLPLGLVALGLIGTTVLCKSFGAIVLLAIGVLALFAMRVGRTSLPMLLLVCIPSVYVGLRASGNWPATEIVELVSRVSDERARSLAFRIDSEEKLRVKAIEQPVLGWGGWSRSSVRRSNDLRASAVTVDSLWIIVFGRNGLVGLASMLLIFLVPVAVLWRRSPPRVWDRTAFVFAWAIAMVFALYALDSVVNAMVNPVYLLIAGGLCGLAPALRRVPVVAHAAQAPRPLART